jgi:glycosyltransferase involved in cell wall biosynthesis
MSRALSDPAFDLVFFPTVYSFVPVFSRARKVVAIHDVIAETYPRLTLPGRGARLFWKAKVALGCRQADAVVTVSDFSRQGLLRHFRLPPERVFVVGEASDPIFRPLEAPGLTPRLAELGVPAEGRTMVYVGGFGPHKNLEALLTAFDALAARQELSDVRLIMVGEYEREVFHSYVGDLRYLAERLGLAEQVIYTGYLPDDELVVLLNLASVLVLPSLMEGFGLPAVEAAACGCPVVATSASPLPALLGEGGRYVDPTRPEELEWALAEVLGSDSLRAAMGRAGREAAQRLSWDAAAEQLRRVLQAVVRR